VIIRTSRADVRPGQEAAFEARILETVRSSPAQNPGLLGYDVLTQQDGLVLVFQSRWRDENAIAQFAGARWATDPVTFPGEDRYLIRPLQLDHFHVVDTYPALRSERIVR
jgi:heme-degrading monooxygenase HmoA